MKKILIIFSLLTFCSCNHRFFVRGENVVTIKNGCIILISDEYYFVEHKFSKDKDFLQFISAPDKRLCSLPFRISCQFKGTLNPSSFKTFNQNILPQGSSMLGSETKYLNALIKLVQNNQLHDYGNMELRLQDYKNLEKEYVLKYRIEDKTLLLVIPDYKD